MKVFDIGSGAGDVSFLVAELAPWWNCTIAATERSELEQLARSSCHSAKQIASYRRIASS